MDQVEQYWGMFVAFGPKLVLAIVTLIVGLWLIGKLMRLFKATLAKRQVDPTLEGFLESIFSVVLKIMLLISVASMVGVETTSFIALLGAAGLAIGLALQGSLANFAGGVLILFFKPFKVGDVIVSVDAKYFRPTEVETLLGDPSKAKAKLGWQPETSFQQLVVEMVQHDLSVAKKNALLKSHGYEVSLSNED